MVKAQTKQTSSAIRSPGPVRTKTGAQVAYMFGLGCSLYGWKAKKITFLMVLVPCQILFKPKGINRTSWCLEPVPVLHHRIWAFGPCIVLEPIRVASSVGCTTLNSIYQYQPSPLGFGFCLNYSVKNSFTVRSVWKTLTCELNHSSAILVVMRDVRSRSSDRYW